MCPGNSVFKTTKDAYASFVGLAYQDSNLDKQNQNLSYYHYTIGQFPLFLIWECKNKRGWYACKIFFKKSKFFSALLLRLPNLAAEMQRIEWYEQVFWADPQRVLYWERHRILLCADLHLGKTGHFRKEGIAVPQAVYQQDLQRLFAAISFHQPARVIMVGDLFHSRANKEWDWFGRWRRDFSTLPFTLILGNHDKLPNGLAAELGLEVTASETIDNILLQHHPATETGNEMIPEGMAVISGHVHPSVIVPAGARQKVRLPCFYFGKSQCLLPAFSLFSGTHPIKPKAKDVVFAIAGQSLVQI